MLDEDAVWLFNRQIPIETLASLLKSAGYRTGAFVGAFVLDARFGLNRGFDEYDDRIGHNERTSFELAKRLGKDVVQSAGDWILEPAESSANVQRPWFAWVPSGSIVTPVALTAWSCKLRSAGLLAIHRIVPLGRSQYELRSPTGPRNSSRRTISG